MSSVGISTTNPAIICSLLQFYYTPTQAELDRRNLTYLIPLVYVIPSFLLSIRIMFILIKNKNKEFSNSFYRLLLVGSVVGLFWWIFYYIVYRLAETPLAMVLYTILPDVGFIDSILYFLASYLWLADMLIPLMLSINRLTVVAFPLQYKKIWEKITFPVLIIFFIIPIIFSWQVWINTILSCKMHYNNKMYAAHFQSVDSPSYLKISMGVRVVTVFSAIFCFIMNFTTIIILFIRRCCSCNHGKQENGQANAELKLFILSLLMFFNLCIMAVIQIGLYLFSANTSIVPVLVFLQDFVVDLICCTPPWFLILMSSNTRQKVFGLDGKTKIITITKTEPAKIQAFSIVNRK